MFSFANKNALIIGAGRNIGRAIALEFARRGSRVAVADIELAGAQETAQLVEQAGGRATGIQCDVTSESSVHDAVTQAERFLGFIDVHMNNAGIIHSGNPEDFPVSEWERMFSVNLFGAVRANALVLPKMLARGQGYIVNTASFAGLYPYATSRIPYAASKAALVSMSENLAVYLLPKGIRVSCLCPGPTMTTSIQGMRPWSENVTMRGPGKHLRVKSQEEVARILADGMCAERIIIATHEEGWEIVRRRGASPDEFIRTKIEEFARGDSGLPR
ncbi:MAG TPA: SDR family oxidoreductase [Steroidobacteraceae bacterium]|nr:SDR family oxidoreductase [Steroidobacteraceae bacterium]